MKKRKQPSAYELIFVDEHIIAAAKSPGIYCIAELFDRPEAVHSGGRGRSSGPADIYGGANLKGLLAERFGEVYTVHRIDRDTSGLVVFARTREAHRHLSGQFQAYKAGKVFEAIVRGTFGGESVDLDFLLRSDGDHLHRTIIDKRLGKKSRTRITLLEKLGPFSLLRAEPATARIHQIRVHLAGAGYPVLCDPLYGSGEPLMLSSIKHGYRGDPFDEKPLLKRTALHAQGLRFMHPATGEALEFTAPYPKDFSSVLYQLRKIYSV